MIHAPTMTAARCDRGLGCCDQPDHVTIDCPTCGGAPAPLRVGAWSPPEFNYCYTCDDAGEVTACRACGYVDFAGARCPDECQDWSGEDVAARVTATRRAP